MGKRKPLFPIGTTYMDRTRTRSDIATVIDILTTYNSKKEVVKIRYISTHNFLGQQVLNTDVIENTIARNLICSCGNKITGKKEIKCYDCWANYSKKVLEK
jgi:hypothetical protein